MLKDKIAIVTGGTRGIGYAIVEKYLANHAVVVLCGSRQETADKAVAALKAKDPSWRVEGIAPDLGSYASVKAAFDGVRERHGRIDILVNNAGMSSSEPLSDYTPEQAKAFTSHQCIVLSRLIPRDTSSTHSANREWEVGKQSRYDHIDDRQSSTQLTM